ncbi:putative adhesin [Haloactinopolyspora alba]|uniref:Putative adhesin n=1 Tax=Haloactinopolyspora alba TaxID=648780 RepID=A0A2P8D5B5_9ACTN|nr:DUF4097 family beta strand repeat-containing protein [Haloactinopolyspora alba]PSK92414.1 putative adhesin [Haloactinopolyspora alba]
MSHDEYPVTFAVDGPVELSVRQTSGDLTVTAADTTDATVDLRASGPHADELIAQTTVAYRSGTLKIETPKRLRGLDLGRSSVDIRVTVPNGSDVDAHSASGDVETTGTVGALATKTGSGDVATESCTEARARTGSGSVHVGRCASAVVHTGSGDVRIEQAADSHVELDTGSGDITVGGTVSGGHVSCASGDLELGAVDGTVELKTASGEITVARAVQGEIRATSTSGDISVGVAEGTAAHLDASSVSGKVRSELDETDAPAASDRTLALSARAVSGSVTVHRAH